MLVYIVVTVLVVVPLWRIHGKVGQNPALSLISAIPLVGLIISCSILAFAKWDIEENMNTEIA